ncbi:MAG: glycosyltransferase family 2 protein [Anaerolineae bacterium]|nr:glycosyltransferase family 2 protein [Anaerolineae bacterium]
MPPPKAAIIIPSWNTRRWLPGCLDGLRAQHFRDFRVILVDNGSTDDSVAYVQQHYPEVEIICHAKNRGFAAAVNAGIKRADSEYVVLLNVDTLPQPDWLAQLVEQIEQSPVEVAGLSSKMLSLSTPGLMDDAGDTFSWYGSARKRGAGQPAENYTEVEEVFSPCAGAALYRRSFLEEVGQFDEGFGSYLEDVDLGLRGRLLGYRYLFAPEAQIFHKSHGAGIGRSRYVFLMTRNRLCLLVKNIPLALLVKHSRQLIYGQFYFFLVYKRPLHSLAGTFSFLIHLPRIIQQRRAIQSHKRVSNQALEVMLSNDLGEPALKAILRSKLRFS